MNEYKKIKKAFNQLSKDIHVAFKLVVNEFIESDEFRETFYKFYKKKELEAEMENRGNHGTDSK